MTSQQYSDGKDKMASCKHRKEGLKTIVPSILEGKNLKVDEMR